MSKFPDAAYWISTLNLTAHVEGGAFRETYRSALKTGERNFCTHIYFLLQQGQFSAFHKIKSDEIWHFYYGDPLIVYEINPDGSVTEHKLGNNPANGESFSRVIKAGNWFGSRVVKEAQYSLAGCTVSPGFDFNDFELADREQLTAIYPQHKQLIQELTRI